MSEITIEVPFQKSNSRPRLEGGLSIASPPNEIIKHMIDIILSIILAFFSLPILLLTAILIKVDSPGPVIYKQVRMGKGGNKIIIFKFRSMRENSEKILAEHLAVNLDAQQEWNGTQKLREDPRITRVGKWVREFSVDELPQLLNIMKGEMSMVGPRPILFEQKDLYGDGIDLYMKVRPGLTGFWQVSGRNHTSFTQRAAYDIYYVCNWSFWLDLKILLRSVWVVLSRDGAY